MSLTASIKDAARRVGFDLCGVARAEALDPGPLDRWLAAGHAAAMTWIAARREERLDPRVVLPGARSVLSLAVNYWHPDPEAAAEALPKIARYARGRDYHNVIRERLRKLRRAVLELAPGARIHTSVDHGPVMEKAWAARSSVGWIGKSGNLLTERYGTWVLLGSLITDLELEPDPPAVDHCGTCTLCLEACPTGAIVADGVVDAGRCISYQTIEHQGPHPDAALAERSRGWAFGCDVCQDVCPWSVRFATAGDAAFAPTRAGASVEPEALLGMDESAFAARYAGTPLMRPGLAGMKRNALVAIGRR